MDGPDSGRTLDLLPRGDVKRMLDRGFTNDNIVARQREFEPLPHRRNGPDENQGLFCLWTHARVVLDIIDKNGFGV